MDFFSTAMQHFKEVQENEATNTPDMQTGNPVDSFRTIINPSMQAEDIEYNKALFWSKLTDLGVYLEEFRPIIEGNGNKLVNSTAGAGKTTCINLEILYDYVTGQHLKIISTTDNTGAVQYVYVPKKYLVQTFLKTGAEDIKIRLLEWAHKLGIHLTNLGSMRFSTIHSEIYAAISALGGKPTIIEQDKVSSIVRSLMKQFHIRGRNSYSPNPTNEEVNDIVGLMGYARNMLDSNRYTHQLMDEYSIMTEILDEILRQFKDTKRSLEVMDYEDMQETLFEALQVNPNVVAFIVNRYDKVIVDEFQDTSQLQYGFLRYYFAGHKEVMVVGDDDQTIYSFRGSDIDIILNKFPTDLQPTIYKLSTNFRCGENILNAVIPSITQNKKRYDKSIKAYNKGGEVKLAYLSDITSILADMKKDSLTGTVGVIARVNQDLIPAAMLLELEGGLPFKLSKGVSLRRGFANQILSLSELIVNRYTDNFERHLKTFLQRSDWKEALMLSNLLKMNVDYNIYNLDDESLRTSVPKLYNNVLQYLRTFKQNQDEKGAYLFLLDYLAKVIYVKDNPFHVKSREFIYFIQELMASHEEIKGMSMEQFHVMMNSTLPAKIDQRVLYTGTPNINLTSVHEAKGKEWNSVYIWNDIVGTFPVQMARELTEAEFEEERRVHFIAWTRAKHKLTVVTQKGKESIFLKECKLETAEGTVNLVPESDPTVVFSKPMENPLLYKTIDEILEMYHNHLNCLDISDDVYREQLVNYQTALATYSLEGVKESIKDNVNYSSAIFVEDEVTLLTNLEKIFEDIVRNIRYK